MERDIFIILTLNTLTIIFGWVIYLAGVPPSTNLFIFAAESIVVLGLISLVVTFIYVFTKDNRNKMFWPAIVILIIGLILSFFNWFYGGLIVLISLLLLILSKSSMLKNWPYITITFFGFFLLAIIPPVEAMLGVYKLSIDYLLIIIALSMVIIGICMFAKESLDTDGYLTYIILSVSFFLLPSFHEIFGIKSNGSFGIYDSAIIYTSTLVYLIFSAGLVYVMLRKEKILKRIDHGYELLRKGMWEDAYRIFNEVSQSGYKDARLFNGIGIALMHLGKFDDAEVFLKESVKMEDSDVYLTNLGNLHYRKGEIDKAIEIYSKVLKRNPDCYLALHNMGKVLLKKGDKKGEEYLKKAEKIKSKGNEENKNYSLVNGK